MSNAFKLLGVITDGERWPKDSMFNCSGICSIYEFACQTLYVLLFGSLHPAVNIIVQTVLPERFHTPRSV